MLEGTAHIFPDDADADELDGCEEQDEHDDGGVARHVDTVDECPQQHHDQVDNRRQGCAAAQVGGQPQGSSGVADDALNGVVQQFPEIPLGGPGVPLAGGIGNVAGIVTHPGENAFGEPVVFGQFQNTVPDAAAKGTEIAGIRVQLHGGHFVDDAVKALLEEGQSLAFPPAVLIGGNNVILRLAVQDVHHLPDDLRPLLQVRIDEGDIFPVGMLQSGVKPRFLSEIPGKADDFHGTFPGSIELFQVVEGGIGAAVVHVDDLIVIAAVLKGGPDGRLKGGHVLGLIEAGDDQRQFHGGILPIVKIGLL